MDSLISPQVQPALGALLRTITASLAIATGLNCLTANANALEVIELEEDRNDAPSPTSAPKVLEEIVVSAQKRTESLQSVPLSMTAISGADIREKNLADMNEVADYVPNLDVLAVPTFPSVYMRGLGSSYNRGFEQSVAILIDEVFYGRASYINQALLDLSAIEVLRGPQGSLFGKNASAGAIHFKTALPEDEFSSRGDILTGSDDLLRLRLMATGPLTPTIAWRIALLNEQRKGTVFNTTTGIDEDNRDNQNGRLRLQWDASESFSLGLTVNASLIEQQGPGTQLTLARDRHLAAMKEFDPLTDDDAFDHLSAQDHASAVSRDAYDLTLNWDWSLAEGHTLTSISNVTQLDEIVHFDADFSPIPFLILDNNERLRQLSQELRWTSPPGKTRFVAGLYYLNTQLDTSYDIRQFLELAEILDLTGEGERRRCPHSADPQSCQNEILDDAEAGQDAGQSIKSRMQAEGGPSPIETSLTDFAQSSESFALFGQLDWDFAPRWSAGIGGRLNYEHKQLLVDHRLLNNRTGEEGNAILTGEDALPLIGFSPGPNPRGASIFPAIIPGDRQFVAARSRQDVNFIPKVSLQYHYRPAVMAYGTIARGYKSGGYNAQPVNDQQLEFDEEDALTYEAGMKSTWLGGAARLNVAVFRTEFDDLQVANFNGVSYVVGNAASADIQGIEYETQWLLTPAFLLSFNGALTDAKYRTFTNGPCGAEVIAPPPCDLSGQKLRLAPKLKTALTLAWEDVLSGWPLRLSASLSANYASEVALATDLDPIDTRAAGTRLAARLGIASRTDRWHVSLFGDNITNEKSLAGGQDAPAYRGTHFGGAFADARYEVEFGFDF